MEDKFLKIYIYLLIIVGILNGILGIVYWFSQSFIVMVLLGIATLPEFVLILISIALIVYIFVKKIDKIALILPIFYLIGFISLAIYGSSVSLKGGNPLDLSSLNNKVAWALTLLFYIIQIVIGSNLLKKKDITKPKLFKKKEENKSKTLSIVSIVLGIVSFIPLIGLFLGIIAIILGIIDYKKNKNKLGIIGIVLGSLGVILTIALYGSLFYFAFYKRGGTFDELRIKQVKELQLPEVINAIEAYKARYGKYPDKIEDLSKISSSITYTDQIQLFRNDTLFYYQSKGSYYYLFSKGVDGKSFTDDDVFPEFKDDTGKIGYRKP